MAGADLVLLMITFAVAAAAWAERFRTPAPVVLAAIGILGGAAWRFVPGLAPVRLDGDLVLLVFLPPLLFSAAYALPLGAFRKNLGPILLLAVGLVLATMAAAAAAAHWAAGLPWAAALLLGAVVAPPDPVAATSVSEQTGLANRLVVILEGEGLVNDAVAIVAYGLARDAATRGEFSWGHALAALGLQAPGGVLVGLALAWVVLRVRRRMDDVLVEAAIALLVPYLAYRLAERLDLSGVLAVVALGFAMRRVETRIATPAARLASRTVLSAVQFASTVLVFLLVGLLVGELLTVERTWAMLRAGSLVALAAIGVRMAWMYTVPRLYRHHATRGAHEGDAAGTLSWGELTVVGWTGMRGVVTLALALAIPPLRAVPGVGDPRAVMLVIVLAVIVATLVFQGATLLPLVRRLGVGDPERAARDERLARERARDAGLRALAQLAREEPRFRDDCEDLTRHVREGGVGIAAPGFAHLRAAPGQPLVRVLQAQRAIVDEMRDEGELSGHVADRLITELDVDAMSARGDTARLTGSRG